MKITCTVSEFAKMVRNCNSGYCSSCALGSICVDKLGVEQFIVAEDVIPDELQKEKDHDEV